MEQKFKEEVVLPEIQARKQKLIDIRASRVTPINHIKIRKHKKEYIEEVKRRTEEKVK